MANFQIWFIMGHYDNQIYIGTAPSFGQDLEVLFLKLRGNCSLNTREDTNSFIAKFTHIKKTNSRWNSDIADLSRYSKNISWPILIVNRSVFDMPIRQIDGKIVIIPPMEVYYFENGVQKELIKNLKPLEYLNRADSKNIPETAKKEAVYLFAKKNGQVLDETKRVFIYKMLRKEFENIANRDSYGGGEVSKEVFEKSGRPYITYAIPVKNIVAWNYDGISMEVAEFILRYKEIADTLYFNFRDFDRKMLVEKEHKDKNFIEEEEPVIKITNSQIN